MDPSIIPIAPSQIPVFFAFCAATVGFVGVGAAIVAMRATSRERSAINEADIALTPIESWEGAYTSKDHNLSLWLQKHKIAPDSGISDVIRICWSAWTAARSTTLTELHVLVARRERSKLAPKLSGGIAAILLIIGIVGTLWSVHPILKAFQFKTSAPIGSVSENDDSSLVNVAESTDLVNSLMNNLGDAFLPSLTALICTILVVVFRGIYSLNLHRYTLALDRFAIGTVMPKYRPRTITEEYEEVRTTFADLAKNIGEREAKFDKVVTQLTLFVESVEPALRGVNAILDRMTVAADALASKSNSVATTLTRTLGKKSPLYSAVTGFEGIFARTNEELDRLSKLETSSAEEREAARNVMHETINLLVKAVEGVSHDHLKDRLLVAETISEVRSLIADLPNSTTDVVRELFEKHLEEINAKVTSVLTQQVDELTNGQNDLRDQALAAIDSMRTSLIAANAEITGTARSIPSALSRIDNFLKSQTGVESTAKEAIRSVAEEAKLLMKRSIQSGTPSLQPNSAQPFAPPNSETPKDESLTPSPKEKITPQTGQTGADSDPES